MAPSLSRGLALLSLLSLTGCPGIMGWGDRITYSGDAGAAYAMRNPGMEIPQELVGQPIQFEADFSSEFFYQQDDILPDGTQVFRDYGTNSEMALGARRSQDDRLVRQNEVWANFGQSLGLGLIQGLVATQGGGVGMSSPPAAAEQVDAEETMAYLADTLDRLSERMDEIEALREKDEATAEPAAPIEIEEPTSADEEDT